MKIIEFFRRLLTTPKHAPLPTAREMERNILRDVMAGHRADVEAREAEAAARQELRHG